MELQLYKLAEEFSALVEADELTEEDAARLDECSHAIEVKADNIYSLTKHLEGFADLCKAEEERIAAKRKAVENKVKWMKSYLQNCMESAGIMKLEIGTRTVALQKNNPRLVVDDEAKIPGDFWTVIPAQKQLDKKAALAALKDGEVPGCHAERGLSVRFK